MALKQHKTKKMKHLIIYSLMLFSIAVFAQEKKSILLTYQDSIGSPHASLHDVAWIAGHWKGEAMGGIIEEVWTPPLAESMMCMFKLVVNDKVKFYEFITISEEDQSLIMKIKHFSNQLHGWEEKDKTVDFKLVKITENKVYFDDFTFERVNENELTIYVRFEEGQDPVKFNYHKVND